jgi:hypothetical protein
MSRPKSLSLLSVEALFKLRDDVAAALGQKADVLKKQLARNGLCRGRAYRHLWEEKQAEGAKGACQIPRQVGKPLVGEGRNAEPGGGGGNS